MSSVPEPRSSTWRAAAGSDFEEVVPADLLPPERDFCTLHPLRAQPVSGEDALRQPPMAPAGDAPLRAQAVGPEDQQPLRALPVEEQDIPRALPVR